MSIVGPSRPGLFWLLVAVGVACVLLLNLEFVPVYLVEEGDGLPDASRADAKVSASTSASSGGPKTALIPAAARVPTIVARFGTESKEPLDDTGIKALGRAMIEDHDVCVVLEGHSDTVGAEDFNHDLSLERANLVKARVVSMGVSEERIETVGLGATHPLHSDTAGEPSVNRRVEVRWVGKAEFESQKRHRDMPRMPPGAAMVPPAAPITSRDAGIGAPRDAGDTVGTMVVDAGSAMPIAPPPTDSDSGN